MSRRLALSAGLLVFLPGTGALADAKIVCTLVADAATGAVLLEQGDCQSRVTPASTFKIPLAVMGYDAGVLKDANNPVMAFRKGDPDWGGANWTRNTDPASWMRYSVVWYSQRITHTMGAAELTRYARSFGYGNADFTGDTGENNGLDRAWIGSSLKVSPREQVAFLRRLIFGTLPVTKTAMANTRAIIESQAVDGWTVHGKTGTAYPRNKDRSFDYARGFGWYIGWAERQGTTLVFARLTQARERTSGSPGMLTRDGLLNDWPALAARFKP
ncbi:MAG: class D beta-lactamase [Shinella sp.]|nr:MAG: class D beta-lactamase [Shinella sp.]